MMEVLQVLHVLIVCWKKIGHYNMKCQWTPNLPGHYHQGVSPVVDVVKFEVQLYRVKGKFLLDLQKVQGPDSPFLDLCAAFVSQLEFSKEAGVCFVQSANP
ncbi:unnamed protein product [Cuscuta europaea]|uniref:non-specific serine/threonine protein kinase n=1 Tax=Cuscuta europaea TaxID=41803 RepID=A0A9P1E784_CUSEU|nr:unnamed protein product [Cuscuta europaea]CAH9084449.1 unnamed protein product [Cuscuta europaea]